MSIPDSLAEKIELFKATGQIYHHPDDIFRVTSWLQVMLGQRIEPRSYHHIPHAMSDEKIFAGLISIKSNIAAAVEKLPSHADFLKAYCSVK
jgi:tryptophan halogenase